MFDFKITAKCNNARNGIFTTPHGEIHTPVFMPVGTKATVKSLDYKDLESLNTEIILSNTYHLEMRPGSDLVQKMGGLHKWMNWNKPILTDSGGFQVFSLSKSNKITEEGVEFQSHINGDKYFSHLNMQSTFKKNLVQILSWHSMNALPPELTKHMREMQCKRTHNWLERCIKAKTRRDQALFPIIQGSYFKNLREESAKFSTQFDLPGIAIGGGSVGGII